MLSDSFINIEPSVSVVHVQIVDLVRVQLILKRDLKHHLKTVSGGASECFTLRGEVNGLQSFLMMRVREVRLKRIGGVLDSFIFVVVGIDHQN
jgi:hypothetical protein